MVHHRHLSRLRQRVGYGREWATAALRRGDRVAATTRESSTLDDLVEKFGESILPIALDVTDRDADFAAISLAHDTFGRLGVVINNAGYGHFGFLEEVSEAEARPVRDQRVQFTLGYRGGPALPARAGQWAHHPGVVDRGHLGVSRV